MLKNVRVAKFKQQFPKNRPNYVILGDNIDKEVSTFEFELNGIKIGKEKLPLINIKSIPLLANKMKE